MCWLINFYSHLELQGYKEVLYTSSLLTQVKKTSQLKTSREHYTVHDHSHETNVRRKIVKHTCDTLRLLCPEDIEDLIDFEVDRLIFGTFLEEAGVLLKTDSKPMNRLRDLAFRITSALSTLITWDDIYKTLDVDHKEFHHLRWLDLPINEILHGSLATDLTREGIIGFMFIIMGLDDFTEPRLQKVIEDLKIRRMTLPYAKVLQSHIKPEPTHTPFISDPIDVDKDLVDLSRITKKEELRVRAEQKFHEDHPFAPHVKSDKGTEY